MSSGWHLHQSLVDRKTRPQRLRRRRTGCRRSAAISSPACWRMPRAAAAFTTPTVNGYKRYRAYSLAPDRAIWGRDNRGVMMRVLGQPGDAVDASGKPRRRAGGQSISLHGLADLCRARRRRAQARAGPVRRHALRDAGAAAAEIISAKRSRRCAPTTASAPASAAASSIITRTSRKPSSTRFRKEQGDSADVTPGSRKNISICFENSDVDLLGRAQAGAADKAGADDVQSCRRPRRRA